jgi:aromatic ring-opening dioxygenase LigB subunit
MAVRTCVLRCLVILATVGLHGPVRADIVSMLGMPHGNSLIDPTSDPPEVQHLSRQLQRGGLEAGAAALQLRPELIVLMTPHGITDEHAWVLYDAPYASGWQGRHFANITLHRQASKQAAEALLKAGMQVKWAYPELPGGGLHLRWGETIPWAMLQHPQHIPAVIISPPISAYSGGEATFSLPVAQQLLHAGGMLAEAFSGPGSSRTLLIASADLAHTHLATGPYGFNASAQPFEDAIQRWADTGSAQALVHEAGAHAQGAGSCGHPLYMVLHGAMVATQGQPLTSSSSGDNATAQQTSSCLGADSDVDCGNGAVAVAAAGDGGPSSTSQGPPPISDVTGWVGRTYAYAHPQYFGMLVAHWTRPVVQQ